MTFELAAGEHDAELRRLLRENPMPGPISLSFEREPDFFVGAGIEGEVHQTLVALAQGRVGGMASRSIRDGYIDGEPARVGYLSQARLDPAHRGRTALAEGWAKMKELHRSDPAELYVTTIIADNLQARRALERDRPTKPSYRPKGELHTLAMLPSRRAARSPLPPGVTIERAVVEMLPDIAACLQRNYRRYQFAPHWTADILADRSRCRGLIAEDFVVALRRGRVVGCAAVWDQQGFKQNVVRGYWAPLRLLRPLVNVLSRVAAIPRLPPVGAPIPHAYLSHVAADDDEGAVFLSLVARALHAAHQRGLAYLAIGLMERNPLLELVRRRFRHVDYRAILYAVYWQDQEERARRLEARIPHLELATL